MKKSYEKQLSLEIERTEDMDNKLSEVMIRLQALSAALGDSERKDKKSIISAVHSVPPTTGLTPEIKGLQQDRDQDGTPSFRKSRAFADMGEKKVADDLEGVQRREGSPRR